MKKSELRRIIREEMKATKKFKPLSEGIKVSKKAQRLVSMWGYEGLIQTFRANGDCGVFTNPDSRQELVIMDIKKLEICTKKIMELYKKSGHKNIGDFYEDNFNKVESIINEAKIAYVS